MNKGYRFVVLLGSRCYQVKRLWGDLLANQMFGYISQLVLAPIIQAGHVFSNFEQLTKNHVRRISFRMQAFRHRCKSELGSVTSSATVLASGSLPVSFVTFLTGGVGRALGWLEPWIIFCSLLFFVAYLLGYPGLFAFVFLNNKKIGVDCFAQYLFHFHNVSEGLFLPLKYLPGTSRMALVSHSDFVGM